MYIHGNASKAAASVPAGLFIEGVRNVIPFDAVVEPVTAILC
jgi:hypothetical protein